ncbi:MAG: hypothetical protein ABSB82_13085 [Terriglobia bacterium]
MGQASAMFFLTGRLAPRLIGAIPRGGTPSADHGGNLKPYFPDPTCGHKGQAPRALRGMVDE